MKTSNSLAHSTKEHELPDHIWTEELAPDYPIIHLSNQHGTASVALHGAHVIDYTPTHQKPVIFTSTNAIYKKGTAIRGGVPICWPWFSATLLTLPSPLME